MNSQSQQLEPSLHWTKGSVGVQRTASFLKNSKKKKITKAFKFYGAFARSANSSIIFCVKCVIRIIRNKQQKGWLKENFSS